ncbi:MAG TPA: glycoside hydrolase family 2 TIM barrel-domain containing protein [Opitutaceae bacterium]|nr:glycoside hydrolase family 2 TIM barrel-domain containing protein [Opitutaceae bacterium]
MISTPRGRRLALVRRLVPLLLLATIAAARERLPLDQGWRFALRPPGGGMNEPAFDDSSWSKVDLPHTWNAVDGEDGGANYVRGDGWYRRHFETDPRWAGERVFVDFGAANRVAEVWLNGVRLGEHRGGYARFRFDLTEHLRPSGDNVLAVRVNNEPNGIIPLGGDFNMWGGLPRDVSLLVVAPTHIALLDYGSPGVYLTTTALEQDHAEVRVRTLVEQPAGASGPHELRVTVRDATGRVVAGHTAAVPAGPGGTTTVEQEVRIDAPHLWDGRSDPYLYRVSVELRAGDKVEDAVTQPLGLRTITIDPQQGLFLNGRHLAAHGVSRHEDWIDHGNALTRAERREDFALIEEIGATVVRLCHYQHDDYDYQLADADGLLVWAEDGFVGAPPKTPEGNDNAVEQLRELIRQNYNHPSIFCWSVGNETGAGADPLIARLAAVAKQEDPTRYSTYASDHADNDPRNFRTDILGYNRYFGWYGGDYDELGRWLDAWHARNPTRPLGLSEYGAGASIYEHEQNPPPRPRTQAKGPWHPEEWQDELHEHAWLTIKTRPYLWATFVWNMFDFSADSRREGDTPGRNDKGLVTYDRQTRKDAFYWYKANWTEAPLVYITSRRDSLRVEAVTPVKVYSNCDTVELWVNGHSLGTRTSPDCRFIWTDVHLEPGPNRLQVRGDKGSTHVTDTCAWTLTSGVPYRPASDPGRKTRE